MRYSLRLLLIPLLVLLPATAAAADIKIALAADNPPFAFRDDSGSQQGFDIEMANALCAQMQVECQLLPLAKNKLLTALNEGAADAIIALPAAADYGQEVIFSERYYKLGARFVRKTGTKGKIAYKRMAGKNVAVVKDTVFDDFLSDKFSGVNIKRYGNMDSAYAALAASEVEYVLGGRIAQFFWAQAQEGYESAGPNYSTAQYFADVAIAVNTPELRDRFNAALAAVRKNGVYKEINNRYFPFNIYGR